MLPVILSRFTILSQIASMDAWSLLSISFILSILFLSILFYVYKRIVYIMYPVLCQRCDMAFIEPMHRNKPNITYLPVLCQRWQE